MEILIIITLVACVVSVMISVITLLTQKRLAENIGVKSAYDIDTNSYKYSGIAIFDCAPAIGEAIVKLVKATA